MQCVFWNCWLWFFFVWKSCFRLFLYYFPTFLSNRPGPRTSFFLLCVLIRMLFYKNLIVLHHVYNNFLFWYLHRIYTFNNNVNEEGMIKSQMVCVTIVTRNNIVKKLARSYCLCYCATFSLVVDSKECTMFFTEECSTLFVPLKIK